MITPYKNRSIMLTKPRRCEYPDCEEKAAWLTLNRGEWGVHSKLEWYCQHHSNKIVEKGRPEHVVSCPNCNCTFGVN